MFLVLPTGFQESMITSFTAQASAKAQVPGTGIGIGVAGNGAMEREVISFITGAATGCQVAPVPARALEVTSAAAKQECPHGTCNLVEEMKSGLRVVVCTIDNGKVDMWLSILLNPRTKLIILPALFAESDGYYASSELGEQSNVVAAAGMANNAAPASTISSRGGLVGGSS